MWKTVHTMKDTYVEGHSYCLFHPNEEEAETSFFFIRPNDPSKIFQLHFLKRQRPSLLNFHSSLVLVVSLTISQHWLSQVMASRRTTKT